MVTVLRTARAAVASVWLVALILAASPPAAADPMPAASTDYETEALSLCPSGDVTGVQTTLDLLRQHTRTLAQSCDHDAAFAALYTVVTGTFLATVEADEDFFHNGAFVNRQDEVFAYFYFWPYVNWHAGLRDAVPPAWQVAFEAADDEATTAAGNVLLGINAHVVRDLPFALAGLGLGYKEDHDRVNDILWRAYGPAIEVIASHLDDSVDDNDVAATSLDNEALFQLVTTWREAAWHDAALLANALTPLDRALVAAQIEEKAHAQALSLRASMAVGSQGPAERNSYCAAHAWPPDWLGGS